MRDGFVASRSAPLMKPAESPSTPHADRDAQLPPPPHVLRQPRGIERHVRRDQPLLFLSEERG